MSEPVTRERNLTARLVHAVGAAIDREAVKNVSAALEAGADPNGVHILESGVSRTPLTAAVDFASVPAAVSVLLDAGADPDQPGQDGAAPLHMAARDPEGTAAAAVLLLRAGAGVAVRDSKGATPLHHACGEGSEAVVAVLLASGADPEARDNRGRTPLHLACSGGGVGARLLLDTGAAPDPVDESGRTPLHDAALGGWREAVEILLEFDADPNRRAGPADRSRTPLHFLAEGRGGDMAAHALLAAGADPAATDDKGDLALHLAARTGADRVALALLARKHPRKSSTGKAARPWRSRWKRAMAT